MKQYTTNSNCFCFAARRNCVRTSATAAASRKAGFRSYVTNVRRYRGRPREENGGQDRVYVCGIPERMAELCQSRTAHSMCEFPKPWAAPESTVPDGRGYG